MVEALTSLRGALADAPLEFPAPGHADALIARDQMLDQIDDYLIPRLNQIDAPLLVVVAGSTGSGKSTVVNSIVGRNVSEAGVLRPTTRAPVLVCHPDDEAWFSGDAGLLSDLPRSTGAVPQAGSLHIVTETSMQPGLALLDAPDIDSVETENHERAAQLMGAADLWLFTTTAARYADAVPWDYLAMGKDRGTQIALILNRIPMGATAEVSGHLESMVRDQGLGDVRMFAIEAAQLIDGRLPNVSELGDWIVGLANDASARRELVAATLRGALDSLPRRTDLVAGRIVAQIEGAERLRRMAQRRFGEARDDVETSLGTGTVLRREVLDRWQEFVGTGEMMRSVQLTVGRMRDRIKSVFTGEPPPDREVQGALESGIESILISAADEAAYDVVERWKATDVGRDLELAGLDRASGQLKQQANPEIRNWQGFVMDLVREEGGDRRLVARTVSFGVNGIGVALMVVLFSQTGGLTGGEVAVAGGTATVSQAILEAVFGEQAVRGLASKARSDLLERIDRLFDSERERFEELLSGAGTIEVAEGLRQLGGQAGAITI
jgi:energy-coupling factor transporter ATP-binding protein EcfA2